MCVHTCITRSLESRARTHTNIPCSFVSNTYMHSVSISVSISVSDTFHMHTTNPASNTARHSVPPSTYTCPPPRADAAARAARTMAATSPFTVLWFLFLRGHKGVHATHLTCKSKMYDTPGGGAEGLRQTHGLHAGGPNLPHSGARGVERLRRCHLFCVYPCTSLYVAVFMHACMRICNIIYIYTYRYI